MTTPNNNTPSAVINDAYRDAGLLQLGDDLSGEQLAEGMRRLRDLILFLQVESGVKLWMNVDQSITLVDGTQTYTLAPAGTVTVDPRPFRVLQAYYLYTATNVRRPLTVLSWNDWLTLGQAGTLQANRGPISQYFVNKKATQLEVTFWLCPDATEAANGTAHVLLQAQASVITQLNDTIQFPDEWRMALHWGLAADICTGQPQAVIDRCEKNAEKYATVLSAWDVEDAPMSVQPDSRTGVAGNFR